MSTPRKRRSHAAKMSSARRRRKNERRSSARLTELEERRHWEARGVQTV